MTEYAKNNPVESSFVFVLVLQMLQKETRNANEFFSHIILKIFVRPNLMFDIPKLFKITINNVHVMIKKSKTM